MNNSVTVCLATYNGERYLREQIISILASSKVTELIVSDDGSNDATVSIVQEINDARIKLHRGPGRGLIENFEFAISKATGNYIFLSDQDDVWEGRKVDLMLAKLKCADLVVSDCIVVDDKLHMMHPSFFKLRNSGPGIVKNIYKNTYLGCCIAFRSKVLKYVLPFPRNLPMHDWWLGLSVDLLGRVEFLDERLVYYRRHGENASSTAEHSNYSWIIRFKWRFLLLYNLFRLRIKHAKIL
jgi:glycosyltransferase involved in cell wall biosynthesis